MSKSQKYYKVHWFGDKCESPMKYDRSFFSYESALSYLIDVSIFLVDVEGVITDGTIEETDIQPFQPWG